MTCDQSNVPPDAGIDDVDALAEGPSPTTASAS